MRADRGTVTEHGQVDYRLTIDGIRHSLTHLLVVEGRGLIVGGHNDFTRGGARDDLKAIVFFEVLNQLGSQHITDDINVSGF